MQVTIPNKRDQKCLITFQPLERRNIRKTSAHRNYVSRNISDCDQRQSRRVFYHNTRSNENIQVPNTTRR